MCSRSMVRSMNSCVLMTCFPFWGLKLNAMDVHCFLALWMKTVKCGMLSLLILEFLLQNRNLEAAHKIFKI